MAKAAWRDSGTGKMGSQIRKTIQRGAVLIGLGVIAACGPKSTPAPPLPPPPPPPVVYIPPRPIPPLGAAAGLNVPMLGTDGVRQTVNAKLIPAQTVWNLRSAYNVAALNCQKAEHAEILVGYKKFLIAHKTGLAAANRGVDAEFKKRHGAAFIRPREAYMTQVYNYYAFPPTLTNFCDAALLVARESPSVKPAGLSAFSAKSIASFEAMFASFYRSYEQYRADAAAWDAKYAPRSAPASGSLAAPST